MSNAAAKVLVVDDLEDNRNVLSRHLARMGCDVSMATNGREALDAIKDDDHEIVLLDIMMPEMNGFDVIEKVRANKDGKQPSIIAISARHDTDAITRALNMGANDYVTKPYDFPVVWARVEKQLNQARSMSLVREVNTRLMKRIRKLRENEHVTLEDTEGAVDAIIRTALQSVQRGDLQSKLNHEVRTRLHQILGLSQQMQSYDIEKAGPFETERRFRHIEKSGLGLLAIFEDLTDYMTLQGGLPEPADMDVNLRSAVLHEWEMLGGRQDMSAASIEIFTNDPKQTVKASPYYVRKAIAAVLSNAARFNDKPAQVKVRLSPFSEEFYRVAVEDNGIGIPADQRVDVLAPFYQVDNSTTRKYNGLGLGLAIANSVMTLHNGKIELKEAPSGKGAVAELYFPYTQPQPTA
ncbi:MAG: hybrid sensor histidine kinase/response regulator [Parvularculaceae bacterium]|nr:hybrid sensor histidine kinase/response regulator [Caulobacterales bacterium]HRX39419.1 hybrid sensor histidine kinase/response regulator [Parvularculaceae bacterium]